MLTLRHAGALLQSAESIDDLVAIAREVGCRGDPAPLHQDDRRAMGLGADVLDVRVVAGAGALRVLLLIVRGDTPLRDLLDRVATRLSQRAAHGLWLVVAAQRDATGIALACWSGTRPVRVCALLADRARITDSDADTLRAVAAAHGNDDLTTHARWLDALGREALSRRFFRELERVVRELAASSTIGPDDARSEIALLFTSRLLFLAFLEAKGWLDGDPAFLTRTFDRAMVSGGRFHARVLLPLFFGTLNTPLARRAAAAHAFGRIPFLNGGLFAPTAVESQWRRLRFDDAAFGALFGDLFARYRFTAREESATLEEAAIDPEMLGRTFESLMAGQWRQRTGAFYTPHELVHRVSTLGVHTALSTRLGDELAARLLEGGSLGDSERQRCGAALAALSILDPACGSGAFLVHALELISTLHQQVGDPRPRETIRRDTLTRTIFGVDVNPTAVWLCELRLWLAVAIESDVADPAHVTPLPNLDRNIRVGDSLAGPTFLPGSDRDSRELRALRLRYARATGPRKTALARRLDRTERTLAVRTLDGQLAGCTAQRRELVTSRRGRDLFGARYHAGRQELARASDLRRYVAALRRRRRQLLLGGALPFSFPTQFGDVGARGGFALIVGNPPWVRPHRLDPAVREAFRRDFQVARNATWTEGAELAGAGRAFGAQVDLAALFVERSVRLLAPGGACALLLPAKLWRSLAGGGVRRLLTTDTELVHIGDYSDAPAAFDASVYPGLLVARARAASAAIDGASRPAVTVSVVGRDRPPATWRLPARCLAWNDSPGAPWMLLPMEVRRAFMAVRDAGVTLADALGRPHLGVKCGLNDAFLVDVLERDGDHVRVRGMDGRIGLVRGADLRPVVRGQDVDAWTVHDEHRAILWTHDARGTPLDALPPTLAHWLGPHRRALAARVDLRGRGRWWSLFRTEAARSDRWRVVWSDIARSPRAAVIPAHAPSVPLNSCYVMHCRGEDDAFALCALINSPLAAAWLDVLAEPARGGYRRYMGWTMALLPLPRAWDAAREPLAAVARHAVANPGTLSTRRFLEASLEAFALSHADVAPLLAWGHR